MLPNQSADRPGSLRIGRTHERLVRACCATLGASAVVSLATAQVPRTPVEPPVIHSMGQPPLWQPYASAVGAFGRNNDATGGVAFGIHHPITSPVTGVFGLSAEATLFASHGRGVAGARVLGVTRAVNLGYGLDWDSREHNVAFILSFNTAVRRGGLFGHGTTLRVDWIPARGSGVDVGLTVPFLQPYAGRTRRRDTDVSLRDIARGRTTVRALNPTNMRDTYARAARTPLPASADSALRLVREAARLIGGYSNFFSDQHESSRKRDIEATRELVRRVRDTLARVSPDYPHGRTFAAAEQVYMASLERAFTIAAGDAKRGDAVTRRARAGLLTNTLIPYDALFGRIKERPNDISPLIDATRADFLTWLADSSGVSGPAQIATVAVHEAWLDAIVAAHHRILTLLTDSRRVWLPLQLALTPEEHDDQREIDALFARIIGRPFTDGNEITYMHEDRVQLEVARSIYAARDYHVLWVHDFAGRRHSGALDVVGFAQTANAYFPALTRAVARYDSTGKLTTYLLFLDGHYYEANHGRIWMTILADPLGASIRLPAGYDSLEAILRTRQRELRDAVAQSRGLQALAAKHGGRAWLRRTVKVHVNITQPSDFAFRSHHIIAGAPLMPDNLIRDHRKIAFYDVTEAEPHRGGMVLSGVGIGENYATPTWEDRGLLVRGPAVLEVRAAARRLLRLNGFTDADIPAPLRSSGDCQTCVAAGSVDGANGHASSDEMGRALQVHNEPGFGPKQASIAKALLYTLAPRRSVIIAPDGLWLGSTWAGMLAGAALRGVRVYIIAPAIMNAPSAGFPQMARTQDVMLRLLQVRQEFLPQIRAAGGELRIGLYTNKEDVNDLAQQAHAFRAGLDRNPWLRELVPLAPSVLAVFDSAPAVLARAGYHPFVLGRDDSPRLPQLHRKTQFFADSAALVRLGSRPEWRDVVIQNFIERVGQARRGTNTGLYDDTTSSAGAAAVAKLLDSYLANRPAADSARMSFYFTMGTQNQDPRGMMLDGEALYVLSGISGAVGLFDLYSLMARSTWIETQAELDRLLPPYDSWQRRLGRFARFVL